MANSFLVEVITPSKLFYMGEADMVIVKTLTGDEGFMANHAWVCKLLDTGELWIREKGDKEFKIAAISRGFVEVQDTIVIYTDAAEWPGDIDVSRCKNEKERAEQWLKTHPPEEDSQINILKAKLAITKAINRMKVADSGVKRMK